MRTITRLLVLPTLLMGASCAAMVDLAKEGVLGFEKREILVDRVQDAGNLVVWVRPMRCKAHQAVGCVADDAAVSKRASKLAQSYVAWNSDAEKCRALRWCRRPLAVEAACDES